MSLIIMGMKHIIRRNREIIKAHEDNYTKAEIEWGSFTLAA